MTTVEREEAVAVTQTVACAAGATCVHDLP